MSGLNPVSPPPPSLAGLQAQGEAAFVARLGGIVERSPWVAQRAWQRRPFGTWVDVHDAMAACVHEASRELQLALLQAHPELAGREAVAGTMTPESSAEQGRLGLQALNATDMTRLSRLNALYRERFGYPLLVALRQHACLASVFASAEERLGHDAATELAIALQQVCAVMRGRLAALAGDPALLDTPSACPPVPVQTPAESPP